MRIGIIGYGNLGKALVRGLVSTGFSQNDIDINARSQKTRDSVRDEFKDIYVTGNKDELVNRTDVIILVTEPKNAKEVLNEIKDYKIDAKIIVSFMAGITITEIKNMLGEKQNRIKLFRAMPNIAIQDGKGVIGVTYEEQDYDIIQDVLGVLDKLGYVLRLDEDSLNYITVTAASGLAFASCMLNSYQKASNVLINDNISPEDTIDDSIIIEERRNGISDEVLDNLKGFTHVKTAIRDIASGNYNLTYKRS